MARRTVTHRRPTAARPNRGRRGERGAGMVELAFVALLLFLFVGGTFDYGRAWRSGLAANEGVRTAARTGSSIKRERAADYTALSGMKAALTASGLIDGVERVVVFRASSIDGMIPSACKTGSTSACQVITGSQFQTPWEAGSMTTATETNGCLRIASAKNWCPTSRDASQDDAEFYGVWVQVRHDFLFPIIGEDTLIERTAVMRIEPEV